MSCIHRFDKKFPAKCAEILFLKFLPDIPCMQHYAGSIYFLKIFTIKIFTMNFIVSVEKPRLRFRSTIKGINLINNCFYRD